MIPRAKARVVAIVQARMTSERLPGKVLAEIGEQPALALLLARLGEAREVSEILVATSAEPSDEPIVAVAADMGIRVVRGPLVDVLERFRLAVQTVDCDAVVRITGDCPLIDPEVVDAVVARWRNGTEAYVANCVEPLTYPDGLDVEVVSTSALEDAAREATASADREHVTPYVRSHPQRYPAAVLVLEPPNPDIRLTLDTSEDLHRLRAIVDQVGTEARLRQIVAAARATAERENYAAPDG